MIWSRSLPIRTCHLSLMYNTKKQEFATSLRRYWRMRYVNWHVRHPISPQSMLDSYLNSPLPLYGFWEGWTLIAVDISLPSKQAVPKCLKLLQLCPCLWIFLFISCLLSNMSEGCKATKPSWFLGEQVPLQPTVQSLSCQNCPSTPESDQGSYLVHTRRNRIGILMPSP